MIDAVVAVRTETAVSLAAYYLPVPRSVTIAPKDAMHRLIRPLLALSLVFGAASVAAAQNGSAPAPTAEAAVTLTAAERAVYVGVYELATPEGNLAIHIFEDGDRLMGRPDNEEEPSPLTPLGDHRFRPVLMQEALLRFTVENDRAINFAIDFPDERGTMLAFRRP